MRLLLDTHALLWWLDDSERLGATARAAIRDADPAAVSMASLWEIAIKSAIGKLDANLGDLLLDLDRNDMPVVPVTVADCLAVARLPHHHRDPFDRMLIAQARLRDLTIVSDDTDFPSYDVQLLRCS